MVILCEKHPKKAQKYLSNGYLEQWLVGTIGQPELAAIANGSKRKYLSDREKALEIFLRSMCRTLGYDRDPQIFVRNRDIGDLYLGTKKTFEVDFEIEGRGFVWGSLIDVTQTSGIKTKEQQFDSRISKSILIDVDIPNDIRLVRDEKNIFSTTFRIEDSMNQVQIFIYYKIVPIELSIDPSSVSLGKVVPSGRVFSGKVSIKVKDSPDQIKFYGSVQSENESILRVFPSSFIGETEIEYKIYAPSLTSGRFRTNIIITLDSRY